jgi:zinc-ribbon family
MLQSNANCGPDIPAQEERAMFFLFGVRTKAKAIGQVDRPCNKCARSTVQTAIETKRYFTLFFIPIIPIGGSHVVRCNLCGLTLKCSPELKDQLTLKAKAAGA